MKSVRLSLSKKQSWRVSVLALYVCVHAGVCLATDSVRNPPGREDDTQADRASVVPPPTASAQAADTRPTTSEAAITNTTTHTTPGTSGDTGHKSTKTNFPKWVYGKTLGRLMPKKKSVNPVNGGGDVDTAGDTENNNINEEDEVSQDDHRRQSEALLQPAANQNDQGILATAAPNGQEQSRADTITGNQSELSADGYVVGRSQNHEGSVGGSLHEENDEEVKGISSDDNQGYINTPNTQPNVEQPLNVASSEKAIDENNPTKQQGEDSLHKAEQGDHEPLKPEPIRVVPNEDDENSSEKSRKKAKVVEKPTSAADKSLEKNPGGQQDIPQQSSADRLKDGQESVVLEVINDETPIEETHEKTGASFEKKEKKKDAVGEVQGRKDASEESQKGNGASKRRREKKNSADELQENMDTSNDRLDKTEDTQREADSPEKCSMAKTVEKTNSDDATEKAKPGTANCPPNASASTNEGPQSPAKEDEQNDSTAQDLDDEGGVDDDDEGVHPAVYITIGVVAGLLTIGAVVLTIFVIIRRRNRKRENQIVVARECRWEYKPDGLDTDV